MSCLVALSTKIYQVRIHVSSFQLVFRIWKCGFLTVTFIKEFITNISSLVSETLSDPSLYIFIQCILWSSVIPNDKSIIPVSNHWRPTKYIYLNRESDRDVAIAIAPKMAKLFWLCVDREWYDVDNMEKRNLNHQVLEALICSYYQCVSMIIPPISYGINVSPLFKKSQKYFAVTKFVCRAFFLANMQ